MSRAARARYRARKDAERTDDYAFKTLRESLMLFDPLCAGCACPLQSTNPAAADHGCLHRATEWLYCLGCMSAGVPQRAVIGGAP